MRTFVEHRLRPVWALDGPWDFFPACDGVCGPELPVSCARTILVPSVWENEPGLESWRGTAWFRRRFDFPGGNLRLAFGGVSHTAKVFLDGREVGGHYDAYTPWDVLVPAVTGGSHEIVVQVDNAFGPHSSLHIPNDYYTFGGITRPVEAQAVADVFIDKVFATPVRRGGGWDLRVRVRLRLCDGSPRRMAVRVRLRGTAHALDIPVKEGAVSAGILEVGGVLQDLDVEPWTAAGPHLYFLDAELLGGDRVIDDKTDRIGFREVQVRGDQLLLNGAPLRLRGFNRHEFHPDFGCALPAEVMAADLDLIAATGANFVRTAHYPNDARFLDLCDERGIFVWEESHSRQTPFAPPVFLAQMRTNTVEMVENHFNHPSIIIWGSLNECDTTGEEGYAVHNEIMTLLRTLDGSRPVTFAANLRKKDICPGLADIVSWNLYPGWYGMEPQKTAEDLEDLLAWLDSPASRGGRGKPVLLSEFGAEALRGWRQAGGDIWSEEFQRTVLDEALKVYLHHPRVVGSAIWQFCDVRTSREANPDIRYHPIGRPRCMNNKGVFDEYRHPKLSADCVRRHFRDAAAKFDAPGTVHAPAPAVSAQSPGEASGPKQADRKHAAILAG